MTQTWTEVDFDTLGWHDVHVHGWRVAEGDHGTGQLSLDLDYILEWLPPKAKGAEYRFRIAPATLIFREVTSLRVAIDYATPSAAIAPFSLSGIERDAITYPSGHESLRWTLEINWPEGQIVFESPGFTQTLSGPVVETAAQRLREFERTGCGADGAADSL